MLQIHFCDWQWALERRQSLYAQQAPVQELAKRMALRRAFVHWKHCILSGTQAWLNSAVGETKGRNHNKGSYSLWHEGCACKRHMNLQFKDKRHELTV